jgi:hypothetical protein
MHLILQLINRLKSKNKSSPSKEKQCLPDGQFIDHFHKNWPILEGVGQKNKFVARKIFVANLKN